jgi:hypothetical protein
VGIDLALGQQECRWVKRENLLTEGACLKREVEAVGPNKDMQMSIGEGRPISLASWLAAPPLQESLRIRSAGRKFSQIRLRVRLGRCQGVEEGHCSE